MNDPGAVLEVVDLGRSYVDGARSLCVLQGVSFTLNPGQSLAVVGPSGSGKSTLLGLLAGLDHPSQGQVRVAGRDLGSMAESDLAAFRGQHIGFVFQSYRLLASASALENVLIPLELQGVGRERLPRAQEALENVGLAERLHHRPAQLSGGEQQRVALARALVTQPPLLLADEPTGNLDQDSGQVVEDMLFARCREQQVAMIVVTHDQRLAERADRMVRLNDGRMVPAAVQGSA